MWLPNKVPILNVIHQGWPHTYLSEEPYSFLSFLLILGSSHNLFYFSDIKYFSPALDLHCLWRSCLNLTWRVPSGSHAPEAPRQTSPTRPHGPHHFDLLSPLLRTLCFPQMTSRLAPFPLSPYSWFPFPRNSSWTTIFKTATFTLTLWTPLFGHLSVSLTRM